MNVNVCYHSLNRLLMDFAAEYQELHDDELLQLWVERSQLGAGARAALQREIRKRGIDEDGDRAVDVWAEPPQRKLAPPPETFLNLSVLWFWIREVWLRHSTSNGQTVSATVRETRKTRTGGRGSAARAELRYSYEYEGQRYEGRVVRDFLFNQRAADALAFEHTVGDKLSVNVDPRHPNRSYCPSGFGWVESFVLGIVAMLMACVVLIVVLGLTGVIR